MAKQEAHIPHAMLAVVALVAIVGISAIFMTMRIPYGWSQASWADTGHPQLEYPGQPSEKDDSGSSGNNLKSTGSICTRDTQCASDSCSIQITGKDGTLIDKYVCA